MKDKSKTEELSPSGGDQGDGTGVQSRALIECYTETFSFSLRDISEIMSRMSKVCR